MENHCSPPRSRPLSFSSSSDSYCCSQISSPDPDPISIPPENWVLAEDTARDVILRGIQPMREADLKRRDVIDYVQRLIRSSLGYEVFPYGSVPLKTYLPDGDIDLTALDNSKPDDALAHVHAVLEAEQRNHGAEFEVNDVQFIDAEVKLVKCLVQNIVVDISFNQLGGLCTLCFLEQVDRFIGKDHLFKRSIILIKAWCYYESRILGAHHGLISTYALETLVLYIFHMFHSSLNGPMAVLYRFLDYFGSFDWDSYCVSLRGPVSKSSLPDIVAEISDNRGCDALPSDEFFKNCVDMFTVPSRGLEENSRIFSQKHLNIIDPLKGTNNLGRSVHRGNYCRIRSAFRYGARKLGWILDLPRERIADRLHKFFTNTLERSRSERKCWDDMPISGLNFHGVGSSILSSSSFTTTSTRGNLNLLFGFSDEGNNLGLESDYPANGDIIGEFNVEGIGDDPMTYDFLNSRVGRRVFDSSDSHNSSISSFLEKSDATDQTLLPAFATENDSSDNGHLKSINCYDLEDFDRESSRDSKENQSMHCDSICFCGSPTAGVAGSPEEDDSVLDLSGDYDSHVRSLLYGQCCHGHDLSVPSLPTPPVSPSRVRKINPWEHVHHSMHFRRNMEFQQDVDATTIRPPIYPLNHPPITHIAFNSDMKQKPRGTGTFFPQLNCRTNKDKPVFGRKRNQTGGSHWQSQAHTYKTGLTKFHQGTTSFEECSNEVLLEQFSAQEQVHTKGVMKSLEVKSLSHECSLEMTQAGVPILCHSKCGSSYNHQTHSPLDCFSNTNGFVDDPFDKLEFGSIKRWLLGASLTEGSNHEAFGFPCTEVSLPNDAAEAVEWSPRAVSDDDSSRVAVEHFQLRDEGDFPPLL